SGTGSVKHLCWTSRDLQAERMMQKITVIILAPGNTPSRRDVGSPDPVGLAAVDPTNPQTWNRYAYVTNNPVSLVDPLGLEEDQSEGDSGGSSNIAPDLPDDGSWGLPDFFVIVYLCPGPLCGTTLADPPVFLPSTAGMVPDPQAANNAFLSKLKSHIPIICSGGSFDFVGLAGEKSVGNNANGEAGGFFYQQAEYRNGQLTYQQGSLGEVGVAIPDVGAAGYGQVRTGSGTERFVFGEGDLGKKGGLHIGAGGLVGVESGELSIGVFADGSIGPGSGGAGYFLSLSTKGRGCHP